MSSSRSWARPSRAPVVGNQKSFFEEVGGMADAELHQFLALGLERLAIEVRRKGHGKDNAANAAEDATDAVSQGSSARDAA